MEIPSELDGAKVIQYTLNSISNDLGVVSIVNEDNIIEGELPITALAICKYTNGNGYYLFSCDLKWEVIGDTFHDSLTDAIEGAELSFNLKERNWILK